MNRRQIIILVDKLAKDNLTFGEYAQRLEKELECLTLEELKESLLECGVIPESFGHDSSEEKLYSKYTDILLAKAFNFLGINARIVKQRADSADVEGSTKEYSIVGDAKAFRLSRTAKNQKDFKVEALSKWRKDKDFACLICPLYQYPKNTSQIYRQAIERNVTLLSYIHLVYMLSQKNTSRVSYKSLWLAGKKLKGAKNAVSYWKAIDNAIVKIFQKPKEDLTNAKCLEFKSLEKAAMEEMGYLKNKIWLIKKLSHQEAITLLIKSEKLDNKIVQIKKIARLK
ncbi:MAG: HindIII family type II restriction endonuclease [Patescibacteria group bacterium]